MRRTEKLLNLFSSPDRLDRAKILVKIRLNHTLFNHKPADSYTVSFEKLLNHLSFTDSALYGLLRPGGEAAEAVKSVREIFKQLMSTNDALPFPIFYNADQSLALLSYALTRHLKPRYAVETGVGYGITSALVLLAMDRNRSGKLVSIDLPPLSDPNGSHTGAVVSSHLRDRWTLHLGSSGRLLPQALLDAETIDLFISDSANVYTLQRYEFDAVYPKLAPGGAALFNNIGAKFQTYLRSVDRIEFHSIWQPDKPACATGLVFRR